MDDVFVGKFNRLEGWSELGSLRVTAKAGGETLWELCRQLLDSGHPDCVLKMVDEHGLHCLTINSIHKAAKRALRLTDIPNATYIGLRYVMLNAWPSVHFKTQEALLKRQYIEVDGDTAQLTHAGAAAVAEYESVHGAQQIAPPEAPKPKIEVVVPPPKEPRQKKVSLTDRQAEAFRIAFKQPYKWDVEVSAKTAKFMIAAGWIIVANDSPRITTEGQRVYAAHVATVVA